MNVSQAIQTPFGINVFGSALIRIEPDLASINVAVSRLAQHPNDAFGEARKAAQVLHTFLTDAKITDVASSRVTLSRTTEYVGNENRFVGYTATVTFHILLRDLDRMEEILSGIVDAGADQLHSVDLETSRLKEVRAEARRRAVGAAREKAENYCSAAGARLGAVIHIEDVNPDALRRSDGHVSYEIPPDDELGARAFDPGSITVGGAVLIAFEITR